METSGVSSNSSSNSTVAAAKQNTLGKDDFLKLLITQLRHQDPMEPVKDQDFIAQMASFSTLEQIQNMSKSLDSFTSCLTGISALLTTSSYMQQAVSLIGKQVEFAGEGGLLSGLVKSVVIEDGVPLLVVGDQRVSVDKIVSICLPESTPEEETQLSEVTAD